MDKLIAVRISEETYTRIREIAQSEEMAVSVVVRKLLREALKETQAVG